jgi:hypothetical protein
MLEQDTFAAAARSHDDKNLTGISLEINALEDFLRPEIFPQAAHDEAHT